MGNDMPSMSVAHIARICMCVLAFVATSTASSHGFSMWGADLLRFGTTSTQTSELPSSAQSWVPGNHSQHGSTANNKAAICPARKNVKARASMRTDLELKKSPSTTIKNAFQETNNIVKDALDKTQEESANFFQEEPSNDDDANWDEFSPMQTDTKMADEKRSQLELECAEHQDHDMKVRCMLDTLFQTEPGAMYVEENDGKIEVVRSESGETIFTETMTDPGMLLEASSKYNNLKKWDDFNPDLNM